VGMISVLTPVYPPGLPFLGEAYASLKAQDYRGEWEWVLCQNGGAIVPAEIARDGHVCLLDGPAGKVGWLKARCAQASYGEILVELDADDLLTPNALAQVAQAFDDPAVMMAYSNDAAFYDQTWEAFGYSSYWGWREREFRYNGHSLREMIAWEPSAQMMRRIEWAPNHVRAWRRSAYEALGGHDASMAFGDDHDLCCRFYLAYGWAGMRHIDQCLYLYRLHGNNACQVFNAEVQAQTLRNYCKYSRVLAARWARDNGLRLLDLGGRFNAWAGYEVVDREGPGLRADLEQDWPFSDGSVGVLHAGHIFEHLADPVHTMNEAYRVLAGGGWLFVDVPSTDGRGAFQDPTHKSFWNENSIWYYTNRQFARFIQPAYRGRFQVSRVVNYFPSEFEQRHNIPILQADLIALKPPYDDRPVGEVLI